MINLIGLGVLILLFVSSSNKLALLRNFLIFLLILTALNLIAHHIFIYLQGIERKNFAVTAYLFVFRSLFLAAILCAIHHLFFQNRISIANFSAVGFSATALLKFVLSHLSVQYFNAYYRAGCEYIVSGQLSACAKNHFSLVLFISLLVAAVLVIIVIFLKGIRHVKLGQ